MGFSWQETGGLPQNRIMTIAYRECSPRRTQRRLYGVTIQTSCSIAHLCAFRFRVRSLLVQEIVQFSRMVRCAGAFACESATLATRVRSHPLLQLSPSGLAGFRWHLSVFVLSLVRNGFSPFAHTGGEDFFWSRSESGLFGMPIVCQFYANWGKRRETIR